jgi:hypothetical protein
MSKTISIQSVDSVGNPVKETKVKIINGVAKYTMLVGLNVEDDTHDVQIIDAEVDDYREAVDCATIGVYEFSIIVDQD